MIPKILALGLVVLFPTLLFAQVQAPKKAEECSGPAEASMAATIPQPEEVIKLPRFIVTTGNKERAQIYEANTADLYKKIKKDKTITYGDVLFTAYAPYSFDLVECLKAKKAYRQSVGLAHKFFCNYGAIDEPLKLEVKQGDPMGTWRIGMGVTADFLEKSATITDVGAEQDGYVAAGFHLCSFLSKQSLEKIEAMRRSREFRRDQEGFRRELKIQIQREVKMQDLNRFYANYVGHPIMSPMESLHALVLLGQNPKAKQVQAVFKRNRIPYVESEVEKILQTKRESFFARFFVIDDAFGYAKTIGTEMSFANKKDYEKLLDQVLVEAPGHI